MISLPFLSTTDTVVVVAAIVGAVAGVIAAVAGVVAAISGVRGIHLQRGNTQTQDEMAGDIERLADLTESSVEEARLQSPDPRLCLRIGDELVTVAQAIGMVDAPALDVDRIVAAEVEMALRTLPPAPERTVRKPYANLGVGVGMFGPQPVTEDDRRHFREKVETYERALRAWLGRYGEIAASARRAIRIDPVVTNDGRVPARDIVVRLTLPEELIEADEPPKLADPPRRPKFEPRRGTLDSLMMGSRVAMPDLSRIAIPSHVGALSTQPRRRWGPKFDSSGRKVEYGVVKVLHGLPDDLDELRLSVLDLGEHLIGWEIHGDNLAEPTSGQIKLVIPQPEPSDQTIARLDDLIDPR